jgi:hypothetical protein
VRHYSNNKHEASIDLFDGGGKVATLLFHRDNVILPENSKDVLNYPISRINEILSTLRYEKPLGHFFDTETKVGFITTVKEPAGEEES